MLVVKRGLACWVQRCSTLLPQFFHQVCRDSDLVPALRTCRSLLRVPASCTRELILNLDCVRLLVEAGDGGSRSLGRCAAQKIAKRISGVLELLDVLKAGALYAFLAFINVYLLVEEFRVCAALTDIEITWARHLISEVLLSLRFH